MQINRIKVFFEKPSFEKELQKRKQKIFLKNFYLFETKLKQKVLDRL
jgi:hypothetical protein